MQQKMVDFSVKGLALDDRSQMPVVILQNEEKSHMLPMVIGPFEASAIIMEIEGVHPPRPLTHDLFSELFQRHRFHMVSVEIYDRSDEEYFARIRYRTHKSSHTMEVRPSDGIALALRLNAPILVSEEIAASASPDLLHAGTDDQEILFLESSVPKIHFM